jgi:acetamidase/formamidase
LLSLIQAYVGKFVLAIHILVLTVLPQRVSLTHMKCTHTIHDHTCHHGWNNANTPAIHVKPGETVEFHTQDASGGQLNVKSTLADLGNLDFGKVNPVTGPVYIDGAEPGDAIKVTLLEFGASGWGWTANIPGFGLLADQFKDPALHIWKYDPVALSPAVHSTAARIPLKPFCGTIGLAPAEMGQHSVVPPRRMGGNLDIRDIAAGTELYLPVEVKGGLLSLGDTHAALESPCTVAAKLELVKGANLSFPRFTTPGPVTRHLDIRGYEVTTGIGPDLMQNARDAVSGMIDLLSRRYKLNAVDAYMLCSVCGDLRISEIVDMPNWVVSFYFPRVVFE